MMKDKVFGDICYDYGWRKKEKIKFWNIEREIEINAVAYIGENITEIQRKEYEWLKNNLDLISEACLARISEYILKNYSSYDIEFKDIPKLISPIEILFERDDKVIGILFNCNFDRENGIGVKIKDRKIDTIGYQNMVI